MLFLLFMNVRSALYTQENIQPAAFFWPLYIITKESVSSI